LEKINEWKNKIHYIPRRCNRTRYR
jgi:hypothetical protein